MLEEKQIPWRDLLECFARRRVIVVTVAGLGIALAVLSAFAEPPSYRATATLELTAQRGSLEVSPGSDSAVTRAKISQQDLGQQVALLQRPALIREVLEKGGRESVAKPPPSAGARLVKGLTYVTKPNQLASKIYAWIHQTPASDPLDDEVQDILSRVEIEPLGRSNLILFSYSHREPERAARFVNDLLDVHLERSFRLDDESSQAREFFVEQRRVLAKRVQEAQAELDLFRRSQGVADLPSTPASLESGLDELRNQRATAVTGLQEVEAKISFLNREILKQPERINDSVTESESESVQKLRAHLLDLELEKSDLLSRYAPGSSVIRDVDRKIEEMRQRVESEEKITAETRTVVNSTRQSLELQLLDAQAQQASLVARVSGLDQQIDGRLAKVRRVQTVAPELARLENEVESSTASYQNYLRKEEEARFAQALDESRIFNLKVIERALPPSHPESSRRVLKAGFACVVALLAGLLLALIRDWLDPTLKGASQAERATGLPVIAEIPS